MVLKNVLWYNRSRNRNTNFIGPHIICVLNIWSLIKFTLVLVVQTSINKTTIEGRSKGGGLRIGWMEKDSMIAHGIGQFMK